MAGVTKNYSVDDFACRISRWVNCRWRVEGAKKSSLYRATKILAEQAARRVDDGDGILSRSEYRRAKSEYRKLFSRCVWRGFSYDGVKFRISNKGKATRKRRPGKRDPDIVKYGNERIHCDQVITHHTVVGLDRGGSICVLPGGSLYSYQHSFESLYVIGAGARAVLKGRNAKVGRLFVESGGTVSFHNGARASSWSVGVDGRLELENGEIKTL